MNLEFVKLNSFASIPVRQTPGSAGLDLASLNDSVVPPGKACRVSTGLAVKIPPNCYIQIAERSGFSYDNITSILGGVIDKDYTGELMVQLLNHSSIPLTISAGDRIAQLICHKIEYPTPVEAYELDKTQRGAAGFGSTGKNKDN